MDTFKKLEIRTSYTGKGTRILQEFLLPVLGASISYDRVAGYYTIESLLAISQGIESLYTKHGKMRLIIGLHSFPKEIVEASIKSEYLSAEIDRIRMEITEGIKSLKDELERKRVATIAWMIDDGLLEVKAAAVPGEGIFHPKTLIFADTEGNQIAAVGSPNETANGLGANFEQLMVANSWDNNYAVQDQIRFFDSLWNNNDADAIVLDISESLALMIKEGLNDHSISNGEKIHDLITAAGDLPANYFVSGYLPALFQHQERAVLDALSRWPVRVLFADEVGLGKTFEAAATMAFLIKYGKVKRVIILTPKSVMQQWQDELKLHFGINAWRYESGSNTYIDPDDNMKKLGNRNPVGLASPDIMLISAQYARGNATKKSIFDREGAILPDLLILDEAHSARVRSNLEGGRTSTRVYKMIESVASKIPHLIFATATPMQKDPLEYHSMLKLLGLPKAWQKTRAYESSLRVIAKEDIPDISDAYTAGKLLRSTILSMNPRAAFLEPPEVNVVDRIMEFGPDADQYDLGEYVQTVWNVFRSVFIKLHPAHLLTVRNTRRALESVGYVFPRRSLIEDSIDNSDEIRLFYLSVNHYICTYCFSVEKCLNPEKKMSIGFIRVNYQQRVASSLYSCKKSLSRRMEKLLSFKHYLSKDAVVKNLNLDFFSALDGIDELAEDDSLEAGEDLIRTLEETNEVIDIAALKHAIDLETTSISSLLSRLDHILEQYGDMKIKRAIDLAAFHVKQGDQVLLFSRYTDTVEALINAFNNSELFSSVAYGVYTGQKSELFINNSIVECSKDEIKQRLRERTVMIMFCSDAASEGLNLQSARILINVDVPWTPARLEQRIGRIARLGQRADEVIIHNIWYPSSIEARMYHRIEKRLKEANIAIGEFPEVVAESIKNAVLNDYDDDDSSAELNEIRNSIQTQALEKLWSIIDPDTTTSSMIRRRLVSIFKSCSCSSDYDAESDLWHFQLSNGTSVCLTKEPGQDESVSYQSLIRHGIRFSDARYVYSCTVNNTPCAIKDVNVSDRYVDFETIPDIILGKKPKEVSFDHYPKMLPDPSSLDLSFTISTEIDQKPILWNGVDSVENEVSSPSLGSS